MSLSACRPGRTINSPDDAASHLLQVRTGHSSQPLTERFGVFDTTEAYRIQENVTGILIQRGERSSGFKAAFTSKPAQEQFGIDSPAYGRLFASMEVENGGTVSHRDFVFFHIEAEVAFKIKRTISHRIDRIDQLIPYVKSLHAAFDAPDLRFKFSGKPNVADIIADSGAAHRYVLGPAHPVTTDLSKVVASLKLDGKEIAGAPVSAAMGNPWNVLMWLSNLRLEQKRTPVRAGDIILSGALGKPYGAKGEAAIGYYEADLGPLGKVHWTVK